MMQQEMERHQVKKPKKEKAVVPDTYKYYCPFCYEITTWDRTNKDQPEPEDKRFRVIQYSKCQGCNAEGTIRPHRCKTCNEKTHIYKDKENQCSKCAKSLGLSGYLCQLVQEMSQISRHCNVFSVKIKFKHFMSMQWG